MQAKLEAEQRFAKGEKVLSGRALFAYNPDLFKDDDAAVADAIVANGAMEDDDDEYALAHYTALDLPALPGRAERGVSCWK